MEKKKKEKKKLISNTNSLADNGEIMMETIRIEEMNWQDIKKNYTPKAGDKIKCSFVFKTGRDSSLSLFDGIQALKDINKYGNVILK